MELANITMLDSGASPAVVSLEPKTPHPGCVSLIGLLQVSDLFDYLVETQYQPLLLELSVLTS